MNRANASFVHKDCRKGRVEVPDFKISLVFLFYLTDIITEKRKLGKHFCPFGAEAAVTRQSPDKFKLVDVKMRWLETVAPIMRKKK